MAFDKVRVRFAPSPTGGLHLGGVRTVLFNYLYARQHKGDFIIRIEDTDQTRFVEGAEQYIFDCLQWCGLNADESVVHGGNFAPYRQSERKAIYQQYAEKLIASGHAYYAFDTPAELEAMREKLKSSGSNSLMYDHHVRMQMKNSLSMGEAETQELLQKNTAYVVRIKIDPGTPVSLTDMIRGEIEFDTTNVDDKVLLKADGMPTYHLAVVVDDFLMKISHAFRGEEWLASAPVHVLLWKHLFGLENMPQWAHLPLILKPDGNGKLSKRDGDRLGFPVFAMDWQDPKTGEHTPGFKELGFLPGAFINMLAMLGWNDGTEQEIFTLGELKNKFSLDRVHKSGAKFDFEKAKWFNHEWIKKMSAEELLPHVKEILNRQPISEEDTPRLLQVINLVKDRCTLLTDFVAQAGFFFEAPSVLDKTAVLPKWNPGKSGFFMEFISRLDVSGTFTTIGIEEIFKQLASEKNIKPGELQLPLRIMLVGGKYGPAVFEIAAILGKNETISRIKKATKIFDEPN